MFKTALRKKTKKHFRDAVRIPDVKSMDVCGRVGGEQMFRIEWLQPKSLLPFQRWVLPNPDLPGFGIVWGVKALQAEWRRNLQSTSNSTKQLTTQQTGLWEEFTPRETPENPERELSSELGWFLQR